MAQAGIKTLLIDANMRDPGVQKLIIPSLPVIGLSECLEMPEGEFGNVIQEDEITIVDAPASNTCADGQLLATQLRYGLIVVRKDASYVADVKTLVGELKANGVELVGTVINEA